MDHSFRGTLIPFVTTYFRCVTTEKDLEGRETCYGASLKKGKIYPIKGWGSTGDYDIFWFSDERGQIITWADYWGIDSVSYSEMLKVILE